MRRLLLVNKQSPGDIVMLTAALRDLHRAHPGQFETWVKTSAMALWEHNATVRVGEPDQALAVEAETIECAYPLIHHSNSRPWHFIHGFHQHLESLLGVAIPPTDFRGDIHLTQQERNWMSQVQEITKVPVSLKPISSRFRHPLACHLPSNAGWRFSDQYSACESNTDLYVLSI